MAEKEDQDFASIVFTLIFVSLASVAAWRLIVQLQAIHPVLVTPSVAVDPTPPVPQKLTIKERSQQLGIRYDWLSQLLDELPKSQQASDLLTKLESLSQAARSSLGTYRRANYNTWIAAVKPLGVRRRSIETLADAQFVTLFPEQSGKTLNPKTFGQIWYAIARDQVNNIQAQTEAIPLNAIRKGTLSQGQGKLYLVQLKPNQTIKLSLKGAGNLSIFPPNELPTILKNSTKGTWLGTVPRSGVYEIVISPIDNDSSAYELRIDEVKK